MATSFIVKQVGNKKAAGPILENPNIVGGLDPVNPAGNVGGPILEPVIQGDDSAGHIGDVVILESISASPVAQLAGGVKSVTARIPEPEGAFSSAVAILKEKKTTKEEFNPTVLSRSDQFVGFSFSLDNKLLSIATIYTSTNLYKIRDLWSDLNDLQISHPLPWAFVGDFNVIMGAHEHRGRINPAVRPVQDFQNWTNDNALFHFPTTGADFTWTNKRDPPFTVERRLDRCIGNSNWIYSCNFIAVCSLPRVCSDHHPLLMEFHVNFARTVSPFKFLSSWSLHDNCRQVILSAWSRKIVGCPMDFSMVKQTILPLVDEATNRVLTNIPSLEEISAAVFSLNGDSAPGPYSFGAFFYQKYWDIIKHDVSNAVIQFFSSGWMLPELNASSIVLIPKIKGANSLDLFRLIVVANFKFKIISKVIADRLAAIMSLLVSPDQRDFIKGRRIHDCIALASEAFNLLDTKTWCGNIALKVDISKAFDTLQWDFLLKVLHNFGFNEKFSWINCILHSAHLSVNVNGSLKGYFSCSRGVRQGDPLSPLLFYLAVEVLSRKITSLVSSNILECSKGPNKVTVPSHILYADDIFLFCKGKFSNIKTIISTLQEYATVSGQVVNCDKSVIFGGAMLTSRLNILSELSVLELGPLLSFAGRVELVKSFVQSMLTHSITVYAWPLSLLRDIERAFKRFIWSGDSSKSKVITVSWKNMCTPLAEGGLGLRSLVKLNEAFNLQLAWNLVTSSDPWVLLLRKRTLRKESISFWYDNWCGDPFHLEVDDPNGLIDQKVSEIFVNGDWDFSKSATSIPLPVQRRIRSIFIPHDPCADARVWKHSSKGELSSNLCYNFKRSRGTRSDWWRWIWAKTIPPSKSCMVCKLLHNRIATDDQWKRRNFSFPSRCDLCQEEEESSHHLFFQCNFATQIWMWVGQRLHFNGLINCWDDVYRLLSKKTSGLCKAVYKAAVIFAFNAIWHSRNKVRF
ncbi:uncharacterized protein LOC131659290 [Vicia villosa]|uniref:uncharacterized protein LOC131659290 n=1 Tax=Vicia villosa TaxID=3911 RepID=UPI00273B0B1D|nr:uncharacterized protein LOC131659290 [Vicia villosa]